MTKAGIAMLICGATAFLLFFGSLGLAVHLKDSGMLLAGCGLAALPLTLLGIIERRTR